MHKLDQKGTIYSNVTQTVFCIGLHLYQKDIASPIALDVSVTINGLSHFLTPDLAQVLCQDLVSMLNHSKPYIRKKVVLVLYKVFLKFPEGLRLSFPRLKDKLEDPDPCNYIYSLLRSVCALCVLIGLILTLISSRRICCCQCYL